MQRKRGEDPRRDAQDGLRKAAWGGDAQTVREAAAAAAALAPPLGVDEADPSNGGATALMSACHRSNAEAALALLDLGANPNIQCPNGLTALAHAAEGDFQRLIASSATGPAEAELKIRCVELLCARGADLELPDIMGQRPLAYAAMGGSHRIASILLDAGADARAQDGRGLDAAAHAAKNSHADLFKLLARHAGPGPGPGGRTLAISAAMGGDNALPILRWLADSGADFGCADSRGTLPSDHARAAGGADALALCEALELRAQVGAGAPSRHAARL